MDYKKAYKETIDKLRKLHNDWGSTQNRAAKEIELVFPELRESEGERIRKNLHKLLCAEICIGTFEKYDLTLDFVLDWLEKKGEQPFWGEDDEEKLRDVIRLVEQGAPVQPIRDHYINWLKSIKDRVQPQPKQE